MGGTRCGATPKAATQRDDSRTRRRGLGALSCDRLAQLPRLFQRCLQPLLHALDLQRDELPACRVLEAAQLVARHLLAHLGELLLGLLARRSGRHDHSGHALVYPVQMPSGLVTSSCPGEFWYTPLGKHST